MIIGTDILVLSVFSAKAPGDHSKSHKAKSFIKMSCMNVGRHHGIELQHPEALFLSLHQTVLHQLFSDMQSPCLSAHRIAGIADMPAVSHIIGM